jgi:phage baseplate assembly protein W
MPQFADTDIDGTLILDEKGFIQTYQGVKAIEESLRNIMFNIAGEYIMHPEISSKLYTLIHEQATSENAFLIRQLLKDEVLEREPRVDPQNLEILVEPTDDITGYIISVFFSYRGVEYSLTQSVGGE